MGVLLLVYTLNSHMKFPHRNIYTWIDQYLLLECWYTTLYQIFLRNSSDKFLWFIVKVIWFNIIQWSLCVFFCIYYWSIKLYSCERMLVYFNVSTTKPLCWYIVQQVYKNILIYGPNMINTCEPKVRIFFLIF